MNTLYPTAGATPPTPARRARTRDRKPPNRLATIFYAFFPVMVAAGVLFVLFIIGGKAEQGYGMRQEAKAVQQRIDQLHKESRRLGEELGYYKSDEYVEKVAREELSLVRPGDVPVVIAVPEGSRKTQSPVALPTPTPPSQMVPATWQRWLSVFVDQE